MADPVFDDATTPELYTVYRHDPQRVAVRNLQASQRSKSAIRRPADNGCAVLKSRRAHVPELIRGSETHKIRIRGRSGYTGDVPMPRLGGKIVSGGSCLALDFILVTEMADENLANMTSKPFQLPIAINRQIRWWVPDFLIERTDGSRELVVVKPLAKIHLSTRPEGLRARTMLDAYRTAAHVAGYEFRLVTEQEIRVQPLLYNAKLFHRHLSSFADKKLIVQGILALTDLPSRPTVADLGTAVSQEKAALELAIRLDRLGHIRLERSARISRATAFGLVSPITGPDQ
jgi:hypothetical protein